MTPKDTPPGAMEMSEARLAGMGTKEFLETLRTPTMADLNSPRVPLPMPQDTATTLHQIERLEEWWNWSGPRPAVPVTAIGYALAEIATLRAQVQAGREAALEEAARLVELQAAAWARGPSDDSQNRATTLRFAMDAIRALAQPAKTEGAEG